MPNLQKRLEAAERRFQKSEEACDAIQEDVMAVGATVPAPGGDQVPVFFAFEGSGGCAMDLLKAALTRPDHQGDASELLTAILLAGNDWTGDEWRDGAVVAGRMIRSHAALLANAADRTVTLYHPRATGEAVVARWSFEEFLAAARWGWGPAAGTDEERKAAYLEGEAFVDVIHPGYQAVWREHREAEEEVFAARRAIEAASRPALSLVPNA